MRKNKYILAFILMLDVGLAFLCVNYFKPSPVNIVAQQIPWDVSMSPKLAYCVSQASAVYQVPPNILAGIMHVEGGRIGQAVGNKNGTHDLGPMQVNSLWVPKLAQTWHVDYKTAYATIRDNGCENVYISAWILKQKIDQTGSLYNGIAYYHSATPRYGHPYADRVVLGMQ